MPEPVQLPDAEEVQSFVDGLTDVCQEPPRLIIVDTLARATVGAEENSARDMGLIIASADELKNRTGAAVLVLHHSGHENHRGRGSSALPGALDTSFGLEEKKGSLQIKCDKQKDWEESATILFQLEKLGDSCVVSVTGSEDPDLRDSHKNLLTVLLTFDAHRGRHKEWMGASDVADSTFNRLLKELKRGGFIGWEDGFYFPLEKAYEALGFSPNEVPRESHEIGSELVPEVPHPFRGGTKGPPSETKEGGQ